MTRMSIRLAAATVLSLAVLPSIAVAQTATGDPKAHCARLLAYWEQHGAGKGEGSGGSDMVRKAAAIDCDSGRYEAGIKAMEDLLRRNRLVMPPA